MKRLARLYSARAVAAMHGAAASTVVRCIEHGELRAHPIIGPDGEVSGYGVPEMDALAWRPRPRGKRRPKGRRQR